MDALKKAGPASGGSGTAPVAGATTATGAGTDTNGVSNSHVPFQLGYRPKAPATWLSTLSAATGATNCGRGYRSRTYLAALIPQLRQNWNELKLYAVSNQAIQRTRIVGLHPTDADSTPERRTIACPEHLSEAK
jgi:hypothetical protein